MGMSTPSGRAGRVRSLLGVSQPMPMTMSSVNPPVDDPASAVQNRHAGTQVYAPSDDTNSVTSNSQVFPHGFGGGTLASTSGNELLSGINCYWTSSFHRPYGSSHELPHCGAADLGLNGVAPFGLPGLLGQGTEMTNQQPPLQLQPLNAAEEVDMLQQLLTNEDERLGNVENYANVVSVAQELNQPNLLLTPNHNNSTVNHDSSCNLHLRKLLPLSGSMINYSANHLNGSLSRLPRQSSQSQPVLDQDTQLLPSAPFGSFLSSELCAIKHPPQILQNADIVTPIAQSAPPATNYGPHLVDLKPSTFYGMQTPANATNLQNSSPDAPGNGPARRNAAGHRNWQAPRRTRTRSGYCGASTARADGAMVLAARRNPGRNHAKLAVLNHVQLERQRRRSMNQSYTTLRSLLPSTDAFKKIDKSSVVLNVINYIKALGDEIEELEGRRSRLLAARVQQPHGVADETSIVAATAFFVGGLTCVDHKGETSSLPPPGNESCLASLLGTNVAIHVCGQNCFITISYPQSQLGLLDQILVSIFGHGLEVICACITTRDNTVVYSFQCQASQDVELLRNNLHTMLQSVVNNFNKGDL